MPNSTKHFAADEQLRILMEATRDAIVCMNEDTEILFANGATYRLFGYSVKELLGQPLTLLVPPENRPRYLEGFRAYLSSGRIRTSAEAFELTACARDGERFPVEVNFGEFELAGKRYFSGAIRDIRERKQAEAELKETHLQLKQITENINEVFWMTDTAKFEMVYISKGYERIWGRSTRSLRDSPLSFIEAIHPEDRTRVVDSMPLQSQGKYDLEYRVIRPDGEIRWVHDRAFPIRDEEGKVYRVCGIAEDITEQKETQALVERERARVMMSSKMSSIGEMSASIAHEINNPLAVIYGRITQILHLAEQGRLELPAVIDSASRIAAMVERISKIVRALRTMARDGGGDPFGVMALDEAVRDTLEICRERFRLASIEIEVDPIPKELVIECRSVQIGQVFLNLLNNAYDAVAGEEAPWIRISCAVDSEFVRLRFTDSGPGIPSNIREKLFDPFFTTKEVGKGTGIGLSVSRAIAEAHRGKLELDETAENTSFVLTLPLKQPSVSQRGAGHEGSTQFRQKKGV